MGEKEKIRLTGLVTGFVNGLFGSGGGTLVVPAMERFLHVETHKAHATAIAVILPLSVLSLLIYFWQGEMAWQVAFGLPAAVSSAEGLVPNCWENSAACGSTGYSACFSLRQPSAWCCVRRIAGGAFWQVSSAVWALAAAPSSFP
ncbi:MAG: sulfite exporter TauE/SafE family protein [Anaerotignum sp.]